MKIVTHHFFMKKKHQNLFGILKLDMHCNSTVKIQFVKILIKFSAQWWLILKWKGSSKYYASTMEPRREVALVWSEWSLYAMAHLRGVERKSIYYKYIPILDFDHFLYNYTVEFLATIEYRWISMTTIRLF